MACRKHRVYIMLIQIDIRGGTGFTYGAGSRVMVVLDDQPVLSSDRGDVSIHLLPMEIVQQMEVIKAPHLYCMAAVPSNSVVALRTAWPGSEPVNTVSLSITVFSTIQILRIINGGDLLQFTRFQLFASESNTKKWIWY